MRHFLTEAERKATGSTFFVEFQKGEFKGTWWHNDSMSIDANDFENLLYKIFHDAVPGYDTYSEVPITQDRWQKIYFAAAGEAGQALDEIKNWAEDCFQVETVFTVCGL